MSRLKNLLTNRQHIKDDIESLEDELSQVNKAIIEILDEKGKARLVVKGVGVVYKQINKKYTWLEDEIWAWYERHEIKPPFKRKWVFNQERLLKDITTKKVPQKLLKKFAKVTESEPFVVLRTDTKK